MKMKVLEVFPFDNGLFSHIDYQFWNFNSDELDLLLLSKCGARAISPIVNLVRNHSDSVLSDSQLAKLGTLILKQYKFKWDKLINLHALEYDILKNYIDEYDEVMTDDDSSSSSKTLAKVEEEDQISHSASSSGSSNTQSTQSTNDSESNRQDTFTSNFSRTTSDTTLRTDDLEESKVENEDSTSLRTDDLLDSSEGTSSDSQTYNGGNYVETTSRQLSSSGGVDSSDSIYGFNSNDAVNDKASSTDSTSSENETITKTHSGQKVDSVAKNNTESTEHTGTQSVDDNVNKSSIKTNSGTQTTTEDVSIQDTTTNNDSQTNTISSEGSSSSLNESTQNVSSSKENNSKLVSKADEDSIINRALNRARKYIHKGNIGNFTPQQLISQEIDLWRWNFIEEVLNDVKTFITIPIYC